MEIGINNKLRLGKISKKLVMKCIKIWRFLIGLKRTVKFWKLRVAGRISEATAERRAIFKIRCVIKLSKLEEIRHK